MDAIPSSVVAAVACAAAAGKNPWLPLGLVFLLAAPESAPSILIEPELQSQLHSLGPAPLLWTLGGVFTALALADSLADKIGLVQKWLVPVSTAWRPFAGIAAASLIGVAATQDAPATAPVVQADLLFAGSTLALTVGAAAVYTWIATIGKTGVRLLTTLVPLPGVRFVHSLVDDFFALGAAFAGLAFGKSALVMVLFGLYLLVGLWTGPLLTRLSWIHVRIGWSLLRKGWRKMAPGTLPEPPGWLARWMQENKIAGAALPAYVYKAPIVGRCRAGFLVVGSGKVAFVSRILWRPRAVVLEDDALARVALADTTTSRVATLVERLERGALREIAVTLFPAIEAEVLPVLERAASEGGLVRVKAQSDSARAGLPGWADRERSVRYLPASEAGSLRLQGILTIGAAVGIGILTAGVFVPIGAGYLFSPFKRRFLLGLAISGYLALCFVGTGGLGWPACVLYASLLNLVALRDLTRQALRARVDGFVDRRAWLPIVSSHVWIARSSLQSERHVHTASDAAPLTDGKWRAVVALLADSNDEGAELVAS